MLKTIRFYLRSVKIICFFKLTETLERLNFQGFLFFESDSKNFQQIRNPKYQDDK
jgi:hypothetical protein